MMIVTASGTTNDYGIAMSASIPEIAELRRRVAELEARPVGVLESTLETPQDASAAARILGRAGGLKGGPVRAARLSPERRKEIAVAGARKRWANRDDRRRVQHSQNASTGF